MEVKIRVLRRWVKWLRDNPHRQYNGKDWATPDDSHVCPLSVLMLLYKEDNSWDETPIGTSLFHSYEFEKWLGTSPLRMSAQSQPKYNISRDAMPWAAYISAMNDYFSVSAEEWAEDRKRSADIRKQGRYYEEFYNPETEMYGGRKSFAEIADYIAEKHIPKPKPKVAK